MSWRSRIVGFDPAVDPEQLLAHPDNWRRHPAEQREALRGSLEQVGWVGAVMVNVQTERVVDGHARVEDAISSGSRVPVLYVDLDPQEESLVLATFDPIGALASTDGEQLGALLAELEFETHEGLSGLLIQLEAEVASSIPTRQSDGLELPHPADRREVTVRCWPDELDSIRGTLDEWQAKGMSVTIR